MAGRLSRRGGGASNQTNAPDMSPLHTVVRGEKPPDSSSIKLCHMQFSLKRLNGKSFRSRRFHVDFGACAGCEASASRRND
eukprot:3559852-Pleurochrysis_carterae.AAC.1